MKINVFLSKIVEIRIEMKACGRVIKSDDSQVPPLSNFPSPADAAHFPSHKEELLASLIDLWETLQGKAHLLKLESQTLQSHTLPKFPIVRLISQHN